MTNKPTNISLTIAFMGIMLITTLVSPPVFAKDKNKEFATDPVVATVDSVPLRITDIENKMINELRHQLYESLNVRLKKTAINQLGKKYKEFANVPLRKVTDKEAKAFYEANGLSSRGSYEQLYPMIKQYIQQKSEVEIINGMYAKAVKRGLIKSFLEAPNDFLVKVPVDTAFLRGNKKARVIVLEFSDYQCPFCAKIQPTLDQLRRSFTNKVVFGYRHSPLPFHREADEAAIATECARDQGKFVPYHNLMFANPKKQFIDDLKEFAKKVEVKNLNQFNYCLDNEKYRARLQKDQKVASEVGIRGTPGFVIGLYDPKAGIVTGEIISGAQPKNVFEEAIKKYLKKSS